MNKLLMLAASVTLAILFCPATAAADVVQLTNFTSSLKNDSFDESVQAFSTNSTLAQGPGLRLRGGLITFDPNLFCALGCRGGQGTELDFMVFSSAPGSVRIEDQSAPLEAFDNTIGKFNVRFDGGTIMLPPATLPPVSSTDPLIGESFTLSVPVRLSGTARVAEWLGSEEGEVLASAVFEGRARVNFILYTLEPGVPFEDPDDDPNPCDKFGEKCWVLDRVTFEAEPVPEPATLLLLGTGLAGVVGVARKRRKAQD